MAWDISKYEDDAVRALPVILLLDTSGSMGSMLGGATKIDKLNEAVKKMLEVFEKESQVENFIRVTVIEFNTRVQRHGDIHMYPAELLESYNSLTSGGLTSLGGALHEAKAIIEDKSTTPNRWYKPAVILVSDGAPTDNWKSEMDNFCNNGRSAKSQRFALAIGADGANQKAILLKFTGIESNLLYAENAADIVNMFERLSQSISQRVSQKNPDDFDIASVPVFSNGKSSSRFISRKTSVKKDVVANRKEDDDDEWD